MRPCRPPTTPHYALTFDGLLSDTPFVEDIREILKTLEAAYQNPVDIEFAANLRSDGSYRIHLLQCRPLQVQGADRVCLPEVQIDNEDRLLQAQGAVIGPSRIVPVDRFIYVVPARYAELSWPQRYEVARLLGRLNQTMPQDGQTIMLLGPGRWGTESPDLGVPVHFAEINRVSVLCEIVTMRENLVPDVSLGTHFLNELIEMNVLYLALFPRQQQNELNERFFLESPNRLLEALPQATRWTDVVRVIDPKTCCLLIAPPSCWRTPANRKPACSSGTEACTRVSGGIFHGPAVTRSVSEDALNRYPGLRVLKLRHFFEEGRARSLRRRRYTP